MPLRVAIVGAVVNTWLLGLAALAPNHGGLNERADSDC